MADQQTMRQWLIDNGRTPPARGPVSKADREFYDAAHGSVFSAEPDADGGVSDADFGETGDTEPSVPLQPERPPRTPRASRGRRPALRLLAGEGEGKRDRKRHPSGRKPPRISLERLTGRLWESLGRVMAGVSPATGNCMQIQAPIAGMLLEDAVRGTLIDRTLQPLARAEEKAEKVAALALPPLCVLGIEHAQTLDPKEAAIRTALLMPFLREGLSLWLDVAGDKVEAAAQRRRDYAEKSAQVDLLIAAIFGQSVVTTAEQVPEPEPAH